MTQFKIGDRVRIKLSIFHRLGFHHQRRQIVTITNLNGNIAALDKPILYEWRRLHVDNIELMKKNRKLIPNKRWWWCEQYRGYGCSTVVPRKKDLVGYCAKHGGDRSLIIRVPSGMP